MARPSLRTHRKFKRLVRMLAIPEAHIIGHLECMWEVGYSSGDSYLGDSFSVEAAAEWVGDDGVFTNAIVTCGFVDELDDGSYSIHDLLDHAPEYVKKRQTREQEKRQSKNKDLRTTDRTTADFGGQRRTTADNVRQRQISAENGHPPTPAPAPTPSIDSLRSSIEEASPVAVATLPEEQPKKRPPSKPTSEPIPPKLDTPPFRAAWESWLEFRRQKKKPFTEGSQKTAFKHFEDMGITRAIAMIEHTIFMGWDGLREPEPQRQGRSPPERIRSGQMYDPTRPRKGFDDD